MNINRRSIAAGITVGLLAGGAGGAIAATTSSSRTASASSVWTPGATGGWNRDGHGWSDGSRTGWSASGNDADVPGRCWLKLVRSGSRAAQTYLALSGSQLRASLQSGETLGQIASGQGKSVAGLEHAIESAAAADINADSALSAAQKSSIIAGLGGVVESIVNGTGDGANGPWPGRPDAPMTGAGW